jgi:argininosuccinate lyase
MAYNKDLQEDKQAAFDTVDTIKNCLQAASIVLKNLHVNEEKTLEAATKGYLNATELADYLVQKDVPFRTAHDTVGKILMYAISQKKELNDLDLSDMRNFSEQIEKDVFEALSLEQTLANKNQIGGTAPERVFEALEIAKQEIERE